MCVGEGTLFGSFTLRSIGRSLFRAFFFYVIFCRAKIFFYYFRSRQRERKGEGILPKKRCRVRATAPNHKRSHGVLGEIKSPPY